MGDRIFQHLTLRELNGNDEDYIYNLMGLEDDEIRDGNSARTSTSSDMVPNLSSSGRSQGIDNIRLFRITNELLERTISFPCTDELEIHDKTSCTHSSSNDVVRSIIAKLSLGEKNMILLLLRKLAFGDKLSLVSDCHFCKEKMTQNVSIIELINSVRNSSMFTSTNSQQNDFTFQLSYDSVTTDQQNGRGYALTIRPITVGDLQEIYDTLAKNGIDGSEISIKKEIIEKIIDMNVLNSVPMLPVDIYENEKDLALAIVEKIGELDPLSNIRMSLTCPQCKNRCLEDFYTEYFIFREIASYHSVMEYDLNWIALHYGWTEGNITDLAISRRKRYVNLINQTVSGV